MRNTYSTGNPGLADHLSIGRVLEVNTDKFTASVYLIAGNKQGSTPECAFRALSKHTLSRSGVVFVPEKDDEVYVDWSYGEVPIITDHVPDVVNKELARSGKQKITPLEGFGGKDKNLEGLGKRHYRWGPEDLSPGDKVIMGKKGNFLGILSGGLSVLRGGPLSQIILSKYKDFVKIVSRNIEIFSDFGIIRTRNTKGKTSFELLGNSSGKKSNIAGETAWDYLFKLGGQNLLDLQLMRDKFHLTIDEDGHTSIKTAASFTIEMATAPEVTITGDQVVKVDGAREEFLTGDHQVVTRGVSTRKMSREVTVVSGAANKSVGGPVRESFLSSYNQTVRGTSATSVDTVGYGVDLAAGDYKITIGDPLSFGVPPLALAAQGSTGGYHVSVFSGDIDLGIAVKGNIKAHTTLGDIGLDTLAGNLSFSTAVGNVEMTTTGGNVKVGSTFGNVEFSTSTGNCVLGTELGNVDIKATVGTIKLSAGTSSIELGPAGMKITNNGIEMLAEIAEAFTNLSSSVTPGFGGPLSSAPLFGVQVVKWKLLQGV